MLAFRGCLGQCSFERLQPLILRRFFGICVTSGENPNAAPSFKAFLTLSKGTIYMSEHKTTSPEKQLALEAIANEFSGENSYSQRARFLEALSRFPVTTFEAMRYLDIYDPRPRIHELRHKYGYGIKTLRQTAVTESGEKHSVGLYVLDSSANQPPVKH